MPKRSQEELAAHPCNFKLKEFEKQGTTQKHFVKQAVPKLDQNGQPIYKEVDVQVKKPCGCKNKNGTPQTETVKQRVMETEEKVVEVPHENVEDNKMVICKLFGTVKRKHCENCNTYKAKNS